MTRIQFFYTFNLFTTRRLLIRLEKTRIFFCKRTKTGEGGGKEGGRLKLGFGTGFPLFGIRKSIILSLPESETKSFGIFQCFFPFSLFFRKTFPARDLRRSNKLPPRDRDISLNDETII